MMNKSNKYRRTQLLFLLVFTITNQLTQAATIVVTATDGSIDNDGLCSISEAIQAANTNAAVQECIAGDDAGDSDTIILESNIILGIEFENDAQFGRTGTPAITTNIIIDGNGHTIERDASFSCVLNLVEEVNEFRLLRVGVPAGNLDLQNIIMKNGCADGLLPMADAKIGGAVLNFSADLQVSNSIFINNEAESRGGAIDTTFGTSIVTNSLFSANNSKFNGAGLSNFTSTTTLSDSTFENNTAGSRGGALFNVDGTSTSNQNTTLSLINNTFSGNSSMNQGGAIYNENALINNSFNNTLANNSASTSGGAIYNTSTGTINVSAFLFHNNGGGIAECINNGGTFTNNFGMTDNASGGCSSTESPQINLLLLTDNTCQTPLADGTCVKTHGLSSSSSARDPDNEFLSLDQRGFHAIGFVGRDIGAYEYMTPTEQCEQYDFISFSGSTFTATVDTAFGLNQAITCANLDISTKDLIKFNSDITLTKQAVVDSGNGATGTVAIDSPIFLIGQGFTLQRDLNFICELDSAVTNTEFRILKVESSGDLDLRSITLKNGCADSFSNQSSGGGVFNSGKLVIKDSTITENKAHYGGGISNNLTSQITSLNNVIISNNIANFSGGGIDNSRGTIDEITNSIIKGNSTTMATSIQGGGGIYNSLEGTLTKILNTSIENNTSLMGGGLLNLSTIDSIKDTTFSGNQATNDGAGIYTSAAINVIHSSTFSGNQATNNGGGIFTKSTLASIRNSTFSDNQAGTQGGALFIDGGSSLLLNSLFRGNFGPNNDCGTSGNGAITGNDNLSDASVNNNTCGVGVSISSGLDNSTVGELADNGCKFTPLADGTCVKTHALMLGSQAIDPTTFISGLIKDQRGFGQADSSRDLGAFEYLPAQQQCDQLGIDISANFTSLVSTTKELRESIICANADDSTHDSINLNSNITLLQYYENIDTGIFNDIASKGRTATPAITSPLTINGMGFSLSRDTNLTCGLLSGFAPEDPDKFRLLRIADTGSLEISNIILANGCLNQNKQVHKFYGGAIYNQGNLSVISSVFSKNSAATGGGIYNYQATVSQISNSIFDQNDVPSFFGGGLANDDGQIGNIVNNTFSQNNAFFGGGGLVNINSARITTIAGNTFDKNNSVFTGAGLYNLSNAEINNIENNTFSGNTGSSGVGNESLISNISNSTFVNNDFGIHNDNGTISSINNSLIDACLNQNGGVLNGSNNLSDNINHSCLGTTLTSNLNIDANLSDNGCSQQLADGTCVFTHALLAGSEAIDQGDANATSIDQRGLEAANVRDIGAFEFEGTIPDKIFSNGFE